MIFVTLGTHEQPFDRLVKEIDSLIKEKIIDEDVFIQIGCVYNYIPNCQYEELISFQKLIDYIDKASIVVTHGGPSSIIQCLFKGKVPIVVPRQKKFGEHINDHQVLYVKKLEDEKKIIAVYDIETLGEKIINYRKELDKLEIPLEVRKSVEKKALHFSKKLDGICRSLFKDRIQG